MRSNKRCAAIDLNPLDVSRDVVVDLLLVGHRRIPPHPRLMSQSSRARRSDHIVVTEDGSELLEGEALGLLEEEVGDDRVADVGGDEDEEELVAELLESDGRDLGEEDVHRPLFERGEKRKGGGGGCQRCEKKCKG